MGLQCGLGRSRMSEDFKKAVSKSNNLINLREHLSGWRSQVKESLSSIKSTLHSIFSRLKPHTEVYESATENEINSFWSSIIAFSATIEEGGVFRKETIHNHKLVCDFLTYCCQASHYTFDVVA